MAVLRTMAAVVVAVTCTEAALQQPMRDGRPLQQSPSALVTQAHDRYKSQQWRRAIEKYEAALAAAPTEFKAWFYLANSFDNLYSTARTGDPARDRYLQKAVEHYRNAAEREVDPHLRKRAMEYLVAAYGPERLNDPAQAEPIVQHLIQLEPENATNYLALAKILEDSGRNEDAEQILLRAAAVAPRSVAVYSATAGFYSRLGDFPKTMAALHRAADLEPDSPEGHQKVAVFYWEKAFRDHQLSAALRREYIHAGIAATDRVLALRRDHVEAHVYKNIFLRLQANDEPDAIEKARLLADADALRERAVELGKTRAVRRGVMTPPTGVAGSELGRADGPAPPARVGTMSQPPRKVKDVPPAYPAEALAARVQGVVIVEVSIDAHGRVADVRVLRSIPLLDQAALDAVRQWEFEPTMVDGAPVPIAATVSVDFRLE